MDDDFRKTIANQQLIKKSRITTIGGPHGPEYRQRLAGACLDLLCTSVQREEELTDDEIGWMTDALLWLNWNSDRTNEDALNKAAALLDVYENQLQR